MMHWVKGTVAKQAHLNIPAGLFEEEHGREGFFGPVTHLYRKNAPTSWNRIEGPLKPHAFDCNRLGVADKDAISARTAVLVNNDVRVSIAQPNESTMPFYFRNADADELYFVHRGEGVIETDFGPLEFKQGDYIVIPRGTTYRTVCETTPYFLVIESMGSDFREPDRGILGQHALYDPAMIETPEPKEGTLSADKQGEWEVRIKREGEMTSVFYPFNPLDVVGWKGNLSVWKVSIHDICPVLSHKSHLPPSVHGTFIAKNFVVCSFVPRPLETEKGAMRVPFYHRNIDYDEVLFYHDGNFFSRDGIDPGMITFHPQGIHHGPHPDAIEASKSIEWTDEIAVMIDTRHPLRMTPEAHSTSKKAYVDSWKPKQQTSSV